MKKYLFSLMGLCALATTLTGCDSDDVTLGPDEADLWLLDLETGEVRPCDELNSLRAESYHAWSANGRWVVFGSRRLDGRYTRLYISHFDGRGRFSKPFLMPQEDPAENRLRLKSFNIPEFVDTVITEITDIKP